MLLCPLFKNMSLDAFDSCTRQVEILSIKIVSRGKEILLID
jgi:hypothetical protein